jgi:hypothetical protein
LRGRVRLRDFDVRRRLETPVFVLELPGREHNDQDYDAWI